MKPHLHPVRKYAARVSDTFAAFIRKSGSYQACIQPAIIFPPLLLCPYFFGQLATAISLTHYALSILTEYKWFVIAITAVCLIEAGFIVWLLRLNRRKRDAEREMKHFAGLAQDSHRQLQEVVSNVPGVVWETRIDRETKALKTTFMSRQVEEMLGYPPAEWLSGNRFGLQIMVEEDREAVIRATDEAIQTGTNRVVQHRWRTKEGRIIWAESHLNPILDKRGVAVGLRGVTLDISERKLAEEELKSSEANYRAVFNAASDAILVLDREHGRILDANQQMTELYGHTVDEVRQLNMGDLSLNEPPYDQEKAMRWMEQAARGKPQLFEWQAKHKSGRLFWVEI